MYNRSNDQTKEQFATQVALIENMATKPGFLIYNQFFNTDKEAKRFISALPNAVYQHQDQLEVAEQLYQKFEKQGKQYEIWHNYFMQMTSWEKVTSASGLDEREYNNIREFAKKTRDHQDESLRTIVLNWG